MCGIFCKFTRYNKNASKCSHFVEDPRLLEILKRRGPDASGSLIICFDHRNEIFLSQKDKSESISNILLNDCSSSLELSGHTLWMQGKSPDVQPLDNEYGTLLFNGDLFNTEWVTKDSDTRSLLQKLQCNLEANHDEINEHIIKLLQTLNGPFSFIYFEKTTKALYFCRDRIGRRSLLLHKDNDDFILSSVLTRKYESAIELPSDKIYRFLFTTNTIDEFPWICKENISISQDISLVEWFIKLNQHNKNNSEIYNFNPSIISESDNLIIELLKNVASKSESKLDFFTAILKEKNISENVTNLTKYLSESVRHRVTTQPKYCSKCIKTKILCENHCTVGILFSGGLDCTILAALTHQFVPIEESIDLLNVAFLKNDTYDTPDRITSIQSHQELCILFPERNWNLIEINVTLEELFIKQQEIIADLIFPLQTVLDESLGSALWFAAMGKSLDYPSTCRILLTGIGADELFGGYTRHRNAFRREGWTGLEKELEFDWQRISMRNLARDDRIISSHSRQPRMPYLDEEFVKFSLNLRPWFKCFPTDTCKPGTGDKMILRLVAFKLGLKNASTYPKRAIQFGSRIANKKENAKDISKLFL